jgi:hypothetical protein
MALGFGRMVDEDQAINAEDVRARFAGLIEMVGESLAETVRACVERGLSATWVAALFDGSDERGVQVYRKLFPAKQDPPKDGAIVVPCALGRLEKVASAAGYKRSRGMWGEHRAGCVRVVAFTFSVIVVQHARTVDMDVAGNA